MLEFHIISHHKSVAKTCYVVARDLLFSALVIEAEPFSWECQSECVSIFQRLFSKLSGGDHVGLSFIAVKVYSLFWLSLHETCYLYL